MDNSCKSIPVEDIEHARIHIEINIHCRTRLNMKTIQEDHEVLKTLRFC